LGEHVVDNIVHRDASVSYFEDFEPGLLLAMDPRYVVLLLLIACTAD
jgi:hypothetical protein